MQIEITTGQEYQRLLARLGNMASNLVASVDRGLEVGTISAASHIATSRLTGQDLNVRSGRLRRAVSGGLISTGTAFVGVQDNSPVKDYAWLLMGGTRTITPKKSKYLAIPLSAALTPTGQSRYPGGPRSIEGLFCIKSKAGNLILMRDKDGGKSRGIDKRYKDKRKKARRLEALFVLKKSVTVTASNALPEGVIERVPNITAEIQNNLDQLINNG